jgi:predicted enzyme involved in methoxymalonyl-ACP biosynthesis
MSDDIVERLRSVLHNDRSVELMNHEAADEIERLRNAELEAARVDQRLIEELWQRRTDASEANARIGQLLGDTEQLKLTVARLTEDLRKMDAITNILFVSIEKRKLREGKQL